MGSWPENLARVKTHYQFVRQEIIGILAAAAITGFIFTFRDWGTDAVNLVGGLTNLFLISVVALISFWFRVSCQKIYGLIEGYKVSFKVWWIGLGIAVVIAFLSRGFVPLVLLGTFGAAFMVRYRLGEFRHGYASWNHGMIAQWGVLGHLILSVLFAVGSYFVPQSYVLHKGLTLNIIAAFCNLVPVPQLDGLNIYFGRRWLYYLALVITILAAILLLTKTGIGLVIAIVVGLAYTGIYLLIGSEK